MNLRLTRARTRRRTFFAVSLPSPAIEVGACVEVDGALDDGPAPGRVVGHGDSGWYSVAISGDEPYVQEWPASMVWGLPY